MDIYTHTLDLSRECTRFLFPPPSTAMALSSSSCCSRLQRSPASCDANPMPAKTKCSALPRWPSSIRSEVGCPTPKHGVTLHVVAAPAPAALATRNLSSRFADVLGNISNLCSEAGEERQAAAECLQRTADEGGRSKEDYGRRALLFQRSGEMAVSSKLKGDRMREELERLQGDILQGDEGRSATDYLWRAELFTKSAEIFGHHLSDEASL